MKRYKRSICAALCAAMLSAVSLNCCMSYADNEQNISFECSLSGVGAGKASFSSRSAFFDGYCYAVLTNTAKASKLAHETAGTLIKPEDVYYPFGFNITYENETPFPEGSYIKLSVPVPGKMKAFPEIVELYSLDSGTPVREELVLTEQDGQKKLSFYCDISGIINGTLSYMFYVNADNIEYSGNTTDEPESAEDTLQGDAAGVSPQDGGVESRQTADTLSLISVTEAALIYEEPEDTLSEETTLSDLSTLSSRIAPVILSAETTAVESEAEQTGQILQAVQTAQTTQPPVISPPDQTAASQKAAANDASVGGASNPHTGVGAFLLIPAAAAGSVVLVKKKGRKRSGRR